MSQIILFIPLFLISFPPASLGIGDCDGANGAINISYSLLDEFHQETSVVRVGGTLIVRCGNTGTYPPALYSMAAEIVPSTEWVNHEFRIKIGPNIAKKPIRCSCGQDKSKQSSELVKMEDFLCGPTQNANCWNAAADVCVDGPQMLEYPYKLRVKSAENPNSMDTQKYCKTLAKAQYEKWGQWEVEVQGTNVELLTMSKLDISFLSENLIPVLVHYIPIYST